MSDINDPLNKFGKFIVENMRDKGIEFYDKLAQDLWKAPSLKLLQEDLKQFNEEQLLIIRQCIVASIDNSVHDFLFALQESSDMNKDVQVVVDGHDVGKLSDGLQGELYTKDGWYSKYSSFGENGKK